MFIDEGSHVEIVAGAWAGRVGIVRKIRIKECDGEVLAFVDVLKPNGWEYEMSMFAPIQLKRRKLTPVQAERIEIGYAAHMLEAAA